MTLKPIRPLLNCEWASLSYPWTGAVCKLTNACYRVVWMCVCVLSKGVARGRCLSGVAYSARHHKLWKKNSPHHAGPPAKYAYSCRVQLYTILWGIFRTVWFWRQNIVVMGGAQDMAVETHYRVFGQWDDTIMIICIHNNVFFMRQHAYCTHVAVSIWPSCI